MLENKCKQKVLPNAKDNFINTNSYKSYFVSAAGVGLAGVPPVFAPVWPFPDIWNDIR